jgi:hypothetical protein
VRNFCAFRQGVLRWINNGSDSNPSLTLNQWP